MNLLDQANHISRQTFSAAVIVDSEGNQAGKVVVRFTPSQIGYNNQVGVIFHPADLSFSKTIKGNSYSAPTTLVRLLNQAGVTCCDWGGTEIVAGHKASEGQVSSESLSRFDDVASIKHGRKQYSVLWAI